MHNMEIERNISNRKGKPRTLMVRKSILKLLVNMGIVWRRFGAPSMEAFFYVLISFLLLNMDLLGEGNPCIYSTRDVLVFFGLVVVYLRQVFGTQQVRPNMCFLFYLISKNSLRNLFLQYYFRINVFP